MSGLFFFSGYSFAQRDYQIVVQNWENVSIRSNYGNPIYFKWRLLRIKNKPQHLDTYKYYIELQSLTESGFDVSTIYLRLYFDVSSAKYDEDFGLLVPKDRAVSYYFYNPNKTTEVTLKKATGWIGTYLNEVEGNKMEMTCEELIEFRDNELFNEWNKAFSDLTIKSETIDLLQEAKKDLENSTAWARSDWNLIPMTVKTFCQTFVDIVGVHPLAFAASEGMNAASRAERMKKFHNTLKTTNNNVKIATKQNAEEVAVEITKQSLKKLHPVTRFYTNLYENVKSFQDHDDLKKEFNKQWENLEIGIEEYNQEINLAGDNLSELNDIKNQIDEYLDEECK